MFKYFFNRLQKRNCARGCMAKWNTSFKISFFTLCFGSFLNWMSYGLIYPLFAVTLFDSHPLFLIGVSDSLKGLWLGVLLAATPLGQFFTAPIIGSLSDHFGRKRILQVTTLIVFVGYLICAIGMWTQSFILLIFGRIVTGIGAGNAAVINSSVADMSDPHAKAKHFSRIAMANGLGFAAGPFIGGKLAGIHYALPFVIGGILTLLSFIFYSSLFTETLHTKKKKLVQFALRFSHILKAAGQKNLRLLFFAFFIFCFSWSFYWEFIPVTWIKVYEQNASQIGNFYAYGSLVYVLSSGIFIQPILKKFKGIPILFGSLFILGAVLLLLLHVKIEIYWISIAVQQFLIALIFPVGTALVSNSVGRDRQGEILGAFQSLQSIAFAVTPFLGGILLELDYSIPLILGGGAMFFACLALLPLLRKRATK
jgi:MFS transporter, DHA1 family, tetracycline resistance protein